jgi:hypothetical protein
VRRVLVVAPHFPPISAADGHRARLSVRHFAEFGWEPFVLTVDPDAQIEPREPALCRTLPPGLQVTAVSAVPLKWSRLAGIGNVAIRALPALHRAGRDLIERHGIDLVYFSTTMFAAMPLGRLWKRATGVPFVLDMQDPWLADYRPATITPKWRMARALHAVLEPFTMRAVDGLVAVSDAYIQTLRTRYPWIAEETCATIPFGASVSDFTAAAELDWQNPFFRSGHARLYGVAVGRGGEDMATAARILFRACRELTDGGSTGPRLFFIGTDYAPPGSGRKTLEPLARREGLNEDDAVEHPKRLPYLEGLRLLSDADFLIVLGSDDAQYSPSKVYPYLLAGRPIVSILHEDSPVVDLMRRASCGPVTTFRTAADVRMAAAQLAPQLRELLPTLPRDCSAASAVTHAFSARELTRGQCDLFARVLRMRTVAEVEACRG